MLEQAQRVLKDIFGYDSFRGRQGAIIERVASGGDALVLMPTGGGKSLCFQVPALLRNGLAVVVSPLIALMDDQVATLEELGVAAASLNSTLSAEQQRDLAARIKRGEVKMLYLAPERLVQPRMLAFCRAWRSRCSPSTKPTACRNGATISVANICNWASWPSCSLTCRVSR